MEGFPVLGLSSLHGKEAPKGPATANKYFLQFKKSSWKRRGRDSNPGPLGAMRKRYLCAIRLAIYQWPIILYIG